MHISISFSGLQAPRVPPLPSWFMEDDKPKAGRKELEVGDMSLMLEFKLLNSLFYFKKCVVESHTLAFDFLFHWSHSAKSLGRIRYLHVS